MVENYDECRSVINGTVLKETCLFQNHIMSYNRCIEKWIPDIVRNNGNISITHNESMTERFKMTNCVFVNNVNESISDIHGQNNSYCGSLHVDIERFINDKVVCFLPKFKLVDIPIMIFSKYCSYSKDDMLTHEEYPGSFIINGKRRFIPMLRSIVNNYPFRFKTSKNICIIHIRSEHINRRHRSTSTLEMVSNDVCDGGKSVRKYGISLNVPFLKSQVPLCVLLLSYECTFERFIDVLKSLYDLGDNIYNCYLIALRNDYLNYENNIGDYIDALYIENSVSTWNNVLHNEVLPHVNQENTLDTINKKITYLAYMFGNLVLFRESRIHATNRDNREYSRIIDSGNSIATLFRTHFVNFLKHCIKMRKRTFDVNIIETDLERIFDHAKFTRKIISSFATGIWSNKRKGISHALDMNNRNAIISQMRRITSSYVNNDGKHILPRMLHPSAFGYECAAECFHPNTQILTWNGDIKSARDIKNNDTLISGMGQKVRVKSTCSGYKRLYDIKQAFGDDYIVTDNHILTLLIINKKIIHFMNNHYYYKIDSENIMFGLYVDDASKNMIDLTVHQYISLPERIKNALLGFKCNYIKWDYSQVDIDPYEFGFFVMLYNRTDVLPYILNSCYVRLTFLFGLLDSPYSIVNEDVNESIIYMRLEPFKYEWFKLLVNSLGLYVVHKTGVDYEWVFIHGSKEKMSVIFKRDACRFTKLHDLSTNTIQIRDYGMSEYVGWQLEGDGRFLLSDCTVVHNTPEGEGCGLINSLALTCNLSIPTDVNYVNELIMLKHGKLISTEIEKFDNDMYKIFNVSGVFVGWCKEAELFLKEICDMRTNLELNPYISISKDDEIHEIRLFNDGGRLLRPLINIMNLKRVLIKGNVNHVQTMNKKTLIEKAIIEYVSPCEEKNYSVTFNIDPLHTDKYLELSSMSFVSVVASLSPFFRHNQGPRLVYWIGMSKQTIISGQHHDNGTPTTHKLWYGQCPIVKTETACHLNLDKRATCVNVNILLYPHSYSQEDAIVMNKASIDRGMFISDSVRTYNADINLGLNGNSDEHFEKPDIENVQGVKNGDYSKLEINGIPKVSTKVNGGDVIIGKTSLIKSEKKNNKFIKEKHDMSVRLKDDEVGTVNSSQIISSENKKSAKVSIITVRRPEIGDKFTSRHAQKGTIGLIVNEEDLPFSLKTGMVPDIIMSPIGITSRMTMGNIIELLLGKHACILGDTLSSVDTQSYDSMCPKQLNNVMDALKSEGFSNTGKDIFIDGKSGEMIEAPIMSGIVSYSKLNHLVSRKAHARSLGPVHPITRQPTEGRRRGGGLRFGPMEAECVIGHSAIGNDTISFRYCKICSTGEHIKTVKMSYATKLMTEELNSTGISVKFDLEENVMF